MIKLAASDAVLELLKNENERVKTLYADDTKETDTAMSVEKFYDLITSS